LIQRKARTFFKREDDPLALFFECSLAASDGERILNGLTFS
jgi:hypothetical protein